MIRCPRWGQLFTDSISAPLIINVASLLKSCAFVLWWGTVTMHFDFDALNAIPNSAAYSSQITGSALAHAKINRKIENSTPCKIVTHEDFNLKLGTRDYVADITHHATLGSNRPSGSFPPDRGNITLLWLFCYTVFFSRSGAQVEPSHWFLHRMAQMTCFRPRMVLLGVRMMGDVIWWKYSPITPQKGAWIGSFKPKRQNLYIAISPERLINLTK